MTTSREMIKTTCPRGASHVLGAEELTPAIDGMTPERAAALCNVPAALIEQAATTYATGPSLLWLSQGVQRQPNGGNIFRALSAVVAFMNGPGVRGVDMATLTCPSLAREATASISHMDFAAVLEDSGGARALVNWNNNPAASPRQAKALFDRFRGSSFEYSTSRGLPALQGA